MEDADRRECAKQPIKGAGVGVRRGREFVTRPRAVGEKVGDAERRRDVIAWLTWNPTIRRPRVAPGVSSMYQP